MIMISAVLPTRFNSSTRAVLRLFSSNLKLVSCLIQRQQIRQFSLTKPVFQKATIYDLWGSYEIEPGIRANKLCKENGDKLIATLPWAPAVKTAWDAFQHGRTMTSGTAKCLGWREGDTAIFWNFNEVHEKAEKLATALAGLGLQRQEKVGIYAGAIPMWTVTLLACIARSLCIVPLHNTIAHETATFIMEQVEMSLLFAESSEFARNIIQWAPPNLRTILIFTEPNKNVVELGKKKNIVVKGFNELLKSVTSGSVSLDLPKPEDLFGMLYTSGTTGNPKGVPHTHRAIVANVAGIDSFWDVDRGPGLTVTKDEMSLNYLPLSHTFALVNTFVLFVRGGAIASFGGDVLKLMEDIQVIKPTHMCMVPRIMNRIYSAVLDEVDKGKIKSALFWYAYKKKKAMLQQGIVTRTSFWDKLAFRKIQRQLGGRLWYMSCGSAPISPEVLEFWRVVFGILITEGFGQTECVCAVTGALDAVGNNVGHPSPCNFVKLVDAPGNEHFVKNGRGEICVKGPNEMTGYYKRPDLTAEVLDKDGWLRTGDIGEFLPSGALRIVDRKKSIFKLAQGVYIAPERIENVYLLCPEIMQIFVDGNSLKNYLIAIVVPEPTTIASWAAKHKVDPKILATNKDFTKFIYGAMTAVGEKHGLKSFEEAKAIRVAPEPFSIDNGLLTPTMKNKRPVLRKFFCKETEDLYQAGPFPKIMRGKKL